MAIHYYTLDTETTGLSVGKHEIFQISMIRNSDKFQITRNIKVKNPDIASSQALLVTNRTKNYLKKIGDPLEKVVEYFNKFFEEDGSNPESRCIVAHKASFDKRFCQADWASISERFPADLWLDTLAFAKKFASHIGMEKVAAIQGLAEGVKPKFTLSHCLANIGLNEVPGAHSATIDCINTDNLFDKLRDSKVSHLPFIVNEPHNLSSY